jgi:hypothetical protein
LGFFQALSTQYLEPSDKAVSLCTRRAPQGELSARFARYVTPVWSVVRNTAWAFEFVPCSPNEIKVGLEVGDARELDLLIVSDPIHRRFQLGKLPSNGGEVVGHCV